MSDVCGDKHHEIHDIYGDEHHDIYGDKYRDTHGDIQHHDIYGDKYRDIHGDKYRDIHVFILMVPARVYARMLCWYQVPMSARHLA